MHAVLITALFSLSANASQSTQTYEYPLLFSIIIALVFLSAILYYRYQKLLKSLATSFEVSPSKEHHDDNLIQYEIEKNRRHEEQIFQQSRLAQIGEMVSMIAHQWRQPLGAIASTAISIETKIRLNKFDFTSQEGIDHVQNYLLGRTQLIAKYVDTLTTTIDDFRNFYQKDKAKEYIHIETIIQRALGIIEGAMSQKGVTILTELDSREHILVYPNEIVQVLLNILQNAYDQFNENGHPNPKITITTHDIDDIIQVEIADNAGGIPEEILPKIFRPYFSTKDKKNGTGIGLYMSKTIIEEHHSGYLHARNGTHGAYFTIQIPRELSKESK